MRTTNPPHRPIQPRTAAIYVACLDGRRQGNSLSKVMRWINIAFGALTIKDRSHVLCYAKRCEANEESYRVRAKDFCALPASAALS